VGSGVGEATERSDVPWAVVLERRHKGVMSYGKWCWRGDTKE